MHPLPDLPTPLPGGSGPGHNYAKHDEVPCQLCGCTFVCLCNRAADCPCAQVNLSRDEAEWIAWQTQGDCVCIDCLVQLRDQARKALA